MKTYKESDFVSINISKISNSSSDPIEKLSEIIEKKLDKMGVDKPKVEVVISKKMWGKIKKIYENFLIRKCGFEKKSEELQEELRFLNYNLPKVFEFQPKWVKENIAYVLMNTEDVNI